MCPAQVVPEPLTEYAIRSDTLKKLTKEAVLNKQKVMVGVLVKRTGQVMRVQPAISAPVLL